ncbi:UDP-2,4-diacetamido-2,4,6-trideoxy-beta-L-altropyranose hydrolase [Pontibacter anaerobius]|uniref:UDP-2,4-diacetamido-2,4, 6-trideoxy-beta-L-altropyranose hydrolase n=1 Tax=Pontibacter anaerobius TaxID=2993940 RepID=A0ABT3RCH1_9BACT|nr:UDP-2,4-diacetamido-2,4,6-trideoxy-beta-L-altropyranose hydrolase [Pontibacter anaerobius]MCX2739108.1 UDP-2,4-diacetamido-2,4,6-trideoxy-beta-L-altropyranose hydrolase [Pontibacter anaerobius]
MAETGKDINQKGPRVVFRADGNSRIGLGHVVRSMALAQMLQGEFSCVFAIQQPEESLEKQLCQVCTAVVLLPVQDVAEREAAYLAEQVLRPTDVVVLDGYRFDKSYQQIIKNHGCALVCIDDIQAYPFVADAVINFAGGVVKDRYKTAPYTRLLLGPEYALLRPPFLEAAKAERKLPDGGLRLLLNLGGADPENHTLRLAQELSQLQAVATVEIVVGAAYRHLPELEGWLVGYPSINLHRNLSDEQMRHLMQSCAVAVTSASGVAYEYAAVGGLLYVLQTADNQEGLYSFLTGKGVAQKYKQLQSINPASVEGAFSKQLQVQRQYFDGKSDERLREEFRRLSLSASLTLRKATAGDMMLVYDWNNDPEVRRHSFNPELIPLANHQAWFGARLRDESTPIYLAEAAGEPTAQIRFTLSGGMATIGYLIAKEFRGQGLGHVVLLKGIAKLLQDHPEVNLIEGLVQQENIASVRAFEKAGFTYGDPDPEHPQAHRFVLEIGTNSNA